MILSFDPSHSRSLIGGILLLPISLVSANEQPCWLQKPVTADQHGQVGVARNLSAGADKPETLSRQRAVERLCQSLGKNCTQDQINSAVEAGQIDNQTLYFEDFAQAGSLFSYAALQPIPTNLCPLERCDLTACDPQWLCSPSTAKGVGVLGISYRSMSLSRQQDLATENALYQAQFLYGVDIRAAKQLRRSQSSAGRQSVLVQQNEFGGKIHPMPPYRVLAQCNSRGSLFQQVEIDHLKPSTLNNSAPPPPTWLKSPKQPGFDGAVGAVERRVASGLLSDQLELAIERAAVELAFEQSSQVKASQIVVSSGAGGIISVSVTSEKTKVSLKARVADVHFEKSSRDELAAYVWLVKIP